MGAGEQRVFQIVKTAISAKPGSLILIDEIDLLLHVRALKNLIRYLAGIANEKKLQVIFSTHSMVMNELRDCTNIIYLQNTVNKTISYDGIPTEFISDMTGQENKPLKIYVEDIVSEKIVKRICIQNTWMKFVKVFQYGAATNAFTIATGRFLSGQQLDNAVIVLDGDVHKTVEDKKKQIEKKYSGTEDSKDKNVKTILSCFTQYNLSNGFSPERNLWSLVVNNQSLNTNSMEKSDEELYSKLCDINQSAILDNHDYINAPIDKVGIDYSDGLLQILQLAQKSNDWQEMIADVQQKINEALIKLNVINA